MRLSVFEVFLFSNIAYVVVVSIKYLHFHLSALSVGGICAWFSERTATLIPGMFCPLLECTYISGRSAALISWSLEMSW